MIQRSVCRLYSLYSVRCHITQFLCRLTPILNQTADRTGRLLHIQSLQIIRQMSVKTQQTKRSIKDLQMENPEILKSDNDKKSYKVIKLPNGLTAMLISDPPPDGCLVPAVEEEEEDSEGMESEGSSENGDERDGEIDAELSHLDGDKHEKQSAAALCIKVGSFSDPDNIPGLAHFLEHMVFMGSKKYPRENEMDDYLNRHGGESNASTDHERTLYYFSIQRKKFRKALDRFANFFISPLLLKDTVDREMQAVDSEFLMSLQSDGDRANELLRTAVKSGHPMKRFMIGNLKSLKHDPEIRGIDVYGKIRKFFNRNYSAHYMTLAVQSMDSLDTLETWVRDIFSNVRNNKLPVPDFSDQLEPFSLPEFTKLFRVIPFEDLHKLEITWALPSLVKKYREKPLDYLTTLIQHEGKGSILSYLKKRLWAVDMSGGSGTECGGFDHNSTWSGFYVCIQLSEEGLKHVMEVATVVFEYIDMLQKLGPEQRIFEELKQIEEAKFRWKEPGDPIYYVEEVAAGMQNYPPENCLTGKTQYFDFDPQLIRECTEGLQPHLANIMLLSKSFEEEGICDKVEPWFGTRYNISDIDSEWKTKWQNLVPNPDLHIPEPNPFIVTNFNLKERKDPSIPKVPYVVNNCKRCKIWYKQEEKFSVPKGIIYLNLWSSLINKTVQNATLCDLLINLLQQTLTESAYPAVLAGYEYSVEGLTDSVLLQLDGFSEKLPILLNMIVDHFVNFTVKPDLFEVIKQQLEKAYYNEMIKPHELAYSLKLSLLIPNYWRLSERYLVVRKMTPSLLAAFHQDLLANITAEGFIFGNFSDKEASDIAKSVQQKLMSSDKASTVVPPRLYQIPQGQHVCLVKSVKVDDANSCVMNYYQAGPGTIHTSSVNQLLMTIMGEPCFDNLRTKHQLAYTVMSEHVVTNGILGIMIMVEHQANKFSMDHVEKLMSEFHAGFLHHLKHMTPEEFRSMVAAMIIHRQTEDTHLGEEASRLWYEIQHQYYVFDRRQKEIEELEKITKKEVILWFKQFLDSCNKKLSLQVEGNSNASVENAPPDAGPHETPTKRACPHPSPLHYLHFLQPDQGGSRYITDIPAFRQQLTLFPSTLINS